VVLEAFGDGGAAVGGVGDLFFFVLEGEIGTETLDSPVEDVVVFEATLVVKVLEKATEEGIIRSVFEIELPAIVHVGGHLFRISLAQELYRSINLTLFDFLILLILVLGSLKPLPWQLAFQHI
jgi:hypothetical protein